MLAPSTWLLSSAETMMSAFLLLHLAHTSVPHHTADRIWVEVTGGLNHPIVS